MNPRDIRFTIERGELPVQRGLGWIRLAVRARRMRRAFLLAFFM